MRFRQLTEYGPQGPHTGKYSGATEPEPDLDALVSDPDQEDPEEQEDSSGNRTSGKDFQKKITKGSPTTGKGTQEMSEDWDTVSGSNKHIQDLRRREKQLTKLIRKTKFDHYERLGGAELLQEVDFNSADIIRQAMSAPIQCGFEAEVMWPTGSGRGFDLDNATWDDIADAIRDQEGERSVHRVQDAYSVWLEENVVPDIESDIMADLIKEYREDEAHLDDFASDRGLADSEELEDYKQDKMSYLETTVSELQARLDQAEADAESETDPEEKATLENIVERREGQLLDVDTEIEERKEWDQDSWAREYIEENLSEEFDEYLEEIIRDNGESWDEAWRVAQEKYDMDEWVDAEYGSHGGWIGLLADLDIHLASDTADVGMVADELSDWAEHESKSGNVRGGGYHSGQRVDNDYWRVEEDSSLESDGEDFGGVEIISPVYDSVTEMMREFKKLRQYLGEVGAETNESTGFHVTMSWGERSGGTNPLKMVLLMGDPYVLKQFNREYNSYTPSQQARLRDAAANMASEQEFDPKNMAQIERILQRSVDWGKYNSIHFKNSANASGNDLIEFRAAGGEGYLDDFDRIAQTVARYAVTMVAGHDKEAFRQDYYKAIAKLMAKVTELDTDGADPYNVKGMIPPGYEQAMRKLTSNQFWSFVQEKMHSAYYRGEDPEPMMEALVQVAHHGVSLGRNQGKMTVRDYMSIRNLMKDFGISPSKLVLALRSHQQKYSMPGALPAEVAVARMIGKKGAIKVSADDQAKTIRIPAGHVLLAPVSVMNALGDLQDPGVDASVFRTVPRSDYDAAMAAWTQIQQDGASNDQNLKPLLDFKNRYGFVAVPSGSEKPSGYSRVFGIFAKELEKLGFSILSESFSTLPLDKKIRLAESLDKNIINRKHQRLREHGVKQSMPVMPGRNEYVDAIQRMWGTKTRAILESSLRESALPDVNSVEILNRCLAAPIRGDDLDTQAEVFAALPVPSMIDDFRNVRGERGDQADLRMVVNHYLQRLHPVIQKQIRVGGRRPSGLTEAIVRHHRELREYTSVDDARNNIIQSLQQMDVTTDQAVSLVDRIYRILNSEHINTTISTAFSKPLGDEPISDKEKEQIKIDMAKILGSLNANYAQLNAFLTKLEKTGSVINIKELMKPLNTFSNITDGDAVAQEALRALATYGVGKKQKGPGEYALAILSNKISLATGEGDLEVDGVGKVELKAAVATSGGRIGYGGGSQKAKRAVIDKYAEHIPTVVNSIGGAGGSLGLGKFINALNQDLPVNVPGNKKIRQAIAKEMLTMDLEKFATPVVNAIAQQEDVTRIEDVYLAANFAWYKDRDDFDSLLLMHIPNGKTAAITGVDDLIKFRRSGHALSTSISIIPTQAGAGREQWAQLTLNKAGV